MSVDGECYGPLEEIVREIGQDKEGEEEEEKMLLCRDEGLDGRGRGLGVGGVRVGRGDICVR